MNDVKKLSTDVVHDIPVVDRHMVNDLYENALKDFNKKIIVLDDDPTGVQTVHDISVFTDWSQSSIEKGFNEQNSMFFILINARGFTAKETEEAHREIASNILKVASKYAKDFIIISRSDSTLRGHYPLETDTLKEIIESSLVTKFDGEIILPFFKEGGRLTINNIHYVQVDNELIPAGETEFAKDRTFGFSKSHLGRWIEEKTNDTFPAENTLYLSLDLIRSLDIEKIAEQLLQVNNFNKV